MPPQAVVHCVSGVYIEDRMTCVDRIEERERKQGSMGTLWEKV
jgi:hypothetical protein